MTVYEIYVEDDRYSVPTLQFINADDEAAAARSAETLLRENHRYRRVEVWSGDTCVFAAGRKSGDDATLRRAHSNLGRARGAGRPARPSGSDCP